MILRFATGVALAGVYPPGMKLMASWTDRDRGLGIGILVGALTIGSATPHLLGAVPIFGSDTGIPHWRAVLLSASALALIAALIVAIFVRPGPLLTKSAPFDWRYAGHALCRSTGTIGQLRLSGPHVGALRHVGWAPILLLAAYQEAGWSVTAARLAGFAVIAVGGVGSVVAGLLADRLGRTAIAGASLAVSGSCALTVGLFFGSPALLTLVCLVWGFAVVADSAQFSTAVSELSDSRYVGSALTMQTSMGFLLTLFTIRLIPPLVERVGWEWAFAVLALGPAFGLWSMWRLRGLPEARKMASGKR